MNLKNAYKSFEGETQIWQHSSETTKTEMTFAVFDPMKKEKPKQALLWLSGLTCTEQNFITKAGAQRWLAENNVLLVCPDTSPRGLELLNEHESWDFGSGAGFYLNAETEGYRDHYRMYDYVSSELYQVIKDKYAIESFAISGHSMGGHGALVIGLKNPEKFKSISAFSPITNPTNCPWGEKAFTGYLGDDRETWKEWDACELLESGKTHPQTLLVDQGAEDEFFEEQLLTPNLVEACRAAKQPFEIRFQTGYDHSYYFVSTFLEEHLKFHFVD